LEAVLFDFDGVIVDTEGPAYQSWSELYASFGPQLPLATWSSAIGTVGAFDAKAHLEALIGRPLSHLDVERRGRRKVELVAMQGLRPGIAALVHEAASSGIKLAIVSSDSASWVSGNLERLDFRLQWTALVTADGDTNRAKPRPDMYVEALSRLGVDPHAAVAVEDSPNGVAAAKEAGLFCLAFVHPITAQLDLSAADKRVDSLDGITIATLAEWLDGQDGTERP
jgi:beta-phosphoglucomutase-like phosphatase (HAD superfamily)